MFIGLNLVGGRVHDTAEWKRREKDAIQWISWRLHKVYKAVVIFGHASPGRYPLFRAELIKRAKAFGKPVLYIQGDAHFWKKHRPFSTALNVTRIIIARTGSNKSLEVTEKDGKFTFNRRF